MRSAQKSAAPIAKGISIEISRGMATRTALQHTNRLVAAGDSMQSGSANTTRRRDISGLIHLNQRIADHKYK